MASYGNGDEEHGSLRIDAPPRWKDVSDTHGQKKPLTDAEIAQAIERRFGISPSTGSKIPNTRNSVNSGNSAHIAMAGAAAHVMTVVKHTSKMLNGEVLEPHTLPPGTAPNFKTSAMQDFCGSSTSIWGPIVDSHFSPCFVQTFLFGLVNLAFVIAATNRLRSLLSTPPPPPRALTRPALLKVSVAAFMAVYLIIMFAIHLAFDYGAPYQWLAYPTSCVTWSLCVAVLLLESRVGAPTNWVCRSFWISSFIAASFLLWSNLAEMSLMTSSDLCAFAIHYTLYAGMAAIAIFHREDPHDYSKLALDFSEMSFDEDKTSVSEEHSAPARSISEQAKPSNSWQTSPSAEHDTNTPFRRIVMLFAEEKLLALSSVVCCFIGAPIEIVQFIYIGMVVDDCAVPDGPRALGGYVAVLVALYLIEAVSSASQLILTMMVGEKMVMRLRRDAFATILEQDVCYLEGGGGVRAQDLCNRLEKDVQRIQEAATLRSCMLLQSLIQILVGTVFLWALSWKLTLIALAILPIIALLLLAQSTVLQSYSKRTIEGLNQIESMATEVISNLRTVRSMGRENAERGRFGAELLKSYKVARAMGVAHGIADGVGVLVLKGCMVLGILYGGTLVHDGELSGGILVSYVFIALQVVMAMSVLPPLVGEMTKALAAGTRVFEMLDRKPQVKARGGMTLAGIEGRLELKQVTLYYPYQPDAPALNRVSLTVEAGTHLALCGGPGSGKTSVVALLLRFLDPQEGLVLLDDTDVSTFDPAWLRQQMALVPQEPILFSCSIADNIAYGQNATPQQIQAAAELVGLHAVVAALPGGYRTEMSGAGEAGDSSELAVLIGLARACIKDAPILLLDEPLARLRGAARAAAARGLLQVSAGRTVVSTSRSAGGELATAADVVAVMSKGGVAELGSHAELVRLGGLYKSLPSAAAEGGRERGADPAIGGRRSRVVELLDDVEALLAGAGAGAGGVGAGVHEEVARLRALY